MRLRCGGISLNSATVPIRDTGLWYGGTRMRGQWKSSGLVNQAVVDRVEREFQPVGDAELVENVVQVIFDGLFADEKFFADFLVPVALGDELDDFLLPLAQQWFFAARPTVGGLRESLHHLRRHPVVQPDFSALDLADALDQKFRGRLLQHDAARAQT